MDPVSNAAVVQYVRMVRTVHTQSILSIDSSFLQVRSPQAREIGTFPSPYLAQSLTPLLSFVLASTQELHEKITELCTRVRDLEDALRTSHGQSSTEPHPLLSDELLLIKAPLQRDGPARNPTIINQQEEENNPDAIDSFGTLAINRSGHTSYYGQFANSWVSSRRSSHLAN